MSITAEAAEKYADKPAVLCCRLEGGTTLEADNLEDPAIFPDLEDSGLLTITDDTLKIKQVLGAKLKETQDALVALTPDLVDGYKEDKTKKESKKEESSDIQEVSQDTFGLQSTNFVPPAGGVLKLHIGKGKNINLEVPMTVQVAGQYAQGGQVIKQGEQQGTVAEESQEEEWIAHELRQDHLKIEKVELGDETKIEGTTLTIGNIDTLIKEAIDSEELVKDLKLDIITPDRYSEYSETIMDVQPLATKVEGELGKGITRVLDGVVFMVTGTDEDGVQIGEFGSSEGEYDRNIMWNRPGSPKKGDIFIKTEVTVRAKSNMERPGPMAAHKASDHIADNIRQAIKKADDSLVVSSEDIVHKRHKGKKKVVIVKEIMGQGAMHDNYILPLEPCGTLGAKANVDLGNLPVVLSPTEILDGGIHALTCIGPASKETSLHYWNEPLVIEALNDEEIDLCGVVLVGSPQANTEKYYVSERLGMLIETMDVDGCIITTEGFGNNHVDFTNHIGEIGKRGIHIVGMSYCAVQGALVTGNDYVVAMVDNNKSKQGIENEILENNCLCPEDAIRAMAMLKTLMGGGTVEPAERNWNPEVKANNIKIIEETTGRKIDLVENEQSLPKSKKRREIYEVEEGSEE